LETVASAGGCAPGGQPNFLIIGPPSPWNLYSSANPSIANHQPVIQNTGTFTLNAGGISSSTPITGVTFEFGTTQANSPWCYYPGSDRGSGNAGPGDGLPWASRRGPTSSPEIVWSTT